MRINSRLVNIIRWWIITGSTGLMAVIAPFTGLSGVERILGFLFYAAMCLYAGIKSIQVTTKKYAMRQWRPSWYEGPYRGGTVRGVAFPVYATQGGLASCGIVIMGMALLGGALYVGVTGRGVEGGAVSRVVAIVLLGFFGFVMSVIGTARSVVESHADASKVVLAADAVHLPLQNVTPGSIPWDAIMAINENVRGGVVLRTLGTLDPRFVLDIHGRDERLARVNVNEMPDTAPLVNTMTGAMRDPALRAALGRPDALARLVPGQVGAAPQRH